MAARSAGKGCKAGARLAERQWRGMCSSERVRCGSMETWTAFEPPKVSLTTQLSLDLDHAPSAHHLDNSTTLSLPYSSSGKSPLRISATAGKH